MKGEGAVEMSTEEERGGCGDVNGRRERGL